MFLNFLNESQPLEVHYDKQILPYKILIETKEVGLLNSLRPTFSKFWNIFPILKINLYLVPC